MSTINVDAVDVLLVAEVAVVSVDPAGGRLATVYNVMPDCLPTELAKGGANASDTRTDLPVSLCTVSLCPVLYKSLPTVDSPGRDLALYCVNVDADVPRGARCASSAVSIDSF